VRQDVHEKIAALGRTLDQLGSVSVAVSGGVDSITLAFAAHRHLGPGATMYHALSPAVPEEATDRTRKLASKFDWQLELIDAREFSNPDYLRNPVNRCFYCKSSLYSTIARRTSQPIISGTNIDDLSDFRPGLDAAVNHGVRHPYVEANIDKRMVREIARFFNLDTVSELPASPCLSSRIETGIRVDADSLRLVHTVEKLVSQRLQPSVVRCRIRRNGLSIELDDEAYGRACVATHAGLKGEIEDYVAETGRALPVEYCLYRKGSAFLRDS
jgi:uncharacterized protein